MRNSDGLDLRGTFGKIEMPDRLDETADYPSLFSSGECRRARQTGHMIGTVN